ncbi:nuclease-related domain-containing protein [Fredinandcohnia humi]
MIKKERKKPIAIPMLEALIRRLPTDHPKIPLLHKELAKRKKGYKGEMALDYYLRFLPNKKYSILHDIRLPDSENFFQIDTLLVSPNFLLILEVKNISGTLLFDDDFKQMIRILNNEEEGMASPFLQARRHRYQLQGWLEERKLSNPPIVYLVVISNPKTIIKAPKSSLHFKMIHSANLPFMIEKIEKRHSKECLTNRDIKKLVGLINRNHTPEQPDFFQQFSIEKSEIVKGVHCPNCCSFSMNRHYGNWFCKQCSTKSKDAHLHALNDYFLLIAPTITNQQLRDFLQFPSSSVSSKLLQSMNLDHTGNTKGRKYKIPHPNIT